MADYVTDTQALVKFMMGKKVINDKAHQAFLSADKGESIIIISAVVLIVFEIHVLRAWSETIGYAVMIQLE